jgi:hypothetical protein
MAGADLEFTDNEMLVILLLMMAVVISLTILLWRIGSYYLRVSSPHYLVSSGRAI